MRRSIRLITGTGVPHRHSCVFVMGAALLAATSGISAQETASSASLEEVVVTGTSIKGVAAVGSPTQSVSIDDIQASGISNTNDLLKALPQFVNLGIEEGRGGSVQGAVGNITQARTVNLRGLGADSTLVLLNGRRMVPHGSQGQFYDLSVIPGNAISRIEVVADGASAIYGSEAVGGVVNVITRNNFSGADTDLRYGWGDDFDEKRAGQNFGTSWGSGDLFISYEHYERSGMLGSKRDVITQDLRPWGGPDLRANFANPGTIVDGSTTYAIPAGQDGRNLTAGDFVAGTSNLLDVNESRMYLGDQERDNVFLSINQDLTDSLSIWYSGYYNDRTYEGEGISVNSGAVTQTLTVPNTNPFFVHPTNPAATSVRVNYSFINDFRAVSSGGEKGYHQVLGLTWNPWSDWSIDVYGSTNRNEAERRIDGQTRTVPLNAALADPDPATAFNPFCDGSAFSCNNPETLARIQGWSFIGSNIRMYDVVAKASGSLFELPGGAVRAALGVEYMDYKAQFANGRNTNTPEINPVIPWNLVERDIEAAFAEVMIPVFGPANAISGVQRLELSIAGRHERYSDFGSTSNPKYGLTWVPLDSLSVRASYGTSFRAPTIFDIDPNATTGPSAVYFTDPTTGQQIRGIHSQGPRPGLQPETATTWTVGLDWTPDVLPGFAASLTYYDVDYVDRLASLSTAQLLANEALFPNLVVRNPSIERVLEWMADPFYTSPPEPPENILIYVDSRRNNLGGTRQTGLDVSLSYAWDTSIGSWFVSADGNYILEALRSDAPGFPEVDILDTINNPVTPRLRGRLGWSAGNWRADAFINHVGGYSNDLVDPAQGVDSWTTVDLSASYSINAGPAWAQGVRIAVSATNALDEDPPVVINTLVGNQGAYDSSNASALGRTLAVEVTKRW